MRLHVRCDLHPQGTWHGNSSCGLFLVVLEVTQSLLEELLELCSLVPFASPSPAVWEKVVFLTLYSYTCDMVIFIKCHPSLAENLIYFLCHRICISNCTLRGSNKDFFVVQNISSALGTEYIEFHKFLFNFV
jgi:hypothetical protein